MRAPLLLGRHEADLGGLNVDALLNYAEYIATDPGRLWQEAGIERKARLRAFMVPGGLTMERASGLEPLPPNCFQ